MESVQTQIADMGSSTSWKRGDLEMLVGELQRQRESKIDFVADQRSLQLTGGRLAARCIRTGEWLPDPLPLTDDAINQFAERLSPSVPRKFFRDALEKHPEPFQRYVNESMARTGSRNLVRCLDGKVRAFLSGSYRAIDNYDVAFAALDAVRGSGGEVMEATLSDRHMRIKFTSRRIFDTLQAVRSGGDGWFAGGLGNQEHLSKVAARSRGDLPGGPHTVHPLVTVSNSETGFGKYQVHLGILQGICFNLATVEESIAQVHLGRRLDTGLFSADTVRLETRAIVAKAKDVIRTGFDQQRFRALIERVRRSTTMEIQAPASAVGNLVDTSELFTEKDRDSLLGYFIKDYVPTAYGLAQAVGRLAQDVDDPDRAFKLESLAGEVMLKPEMAMA